MKGLFKVGDIKRYLQESANESQPVLGKGVSSQKKKENEKAYKETEDRMKKFNKGLTTPKLKNAGASTMAETNKGMSDIQYDSEEIPNHLEPGIKGFTGKQEEELHGKEELGNATRSDNEAIYKNLKNKAKQNKKEGDEASEIGLTSSKRDKESVHKHKTTLGETKTINLLKFKTQFISESHMLGHVPDEYKNEGKRFFMEDISGNKYLVEWHKEPEVKKMINENQVANDFARMKQLWGYKGQSSKTTQSVRMNEEREIDNMLDRVRGLMK